MSDTNTAPTPSVTIDPTTAPTRVKAWLEEVKPAIDAELERRLAVPADDPGRLAEAMLYAATGGGKRLRPALAVAACNAVGGTLEQALPAAASVEMLHAYTLVHDDLPAMDDDDERRGRPTVHKAFGEAIAILAGDGLLTMAFTCLADLGARCADATAALGRRTGAAELLQGQARDLALGDDATLDLETVELIHTQKTGALFSAAAELGGLAGGADADACARLSRYGMAIGIAFQHADDRDDGDFDEHAAEAKKRMIALTDEARELAQGFGERGAMLVAIAEWMAHAA